MNPLIMAFLPYAPEIMTTIVAPFAVATLVKGAQYFGVQIQEKHKRTLQSALTTGANMALAKQLTGPAAVKLILDHVLGKGAPDAVQNFKLNMKELQEMAQGRFQEVANDPLSVALRQAVNNR